MAKGILNLRFKYLKENRQKALVTYFMAGFPTYEKSKEIFLKLAEGGSDIIEVGMPFSDPVADGSIIQMAHEIAIRNGTRFKDVLNITEYIKSNYPNIPLLIMTYYNPILRIGVDRFCKLSKDQGVDGFIVPDLPPEEASDLKGYTTKYGLSLVMLASPTSTRERLEKICGVTDDIVYLVSVTGTTGAREILPMENIKSKVREFREICSKPVVVGFGVSSKYHVKSICEFADGVVVGSLLIKKVKEGKDVIETVRELKSGTFI